MISEYDIEQRILKDSRLNYNKERNMILTEDGKDIISLKSFTDNIRKELGCYFECIFHDHASLTTIYRCKTCGCIIFSGDDERYEPTLRCPVCTDYKLINADNYWTKEEIDSDAAKQYIIKYYIELQKNIDEKDKRYLDRGHKYEWELAKFSIKLFKRKIYFSLECDDVTISHFMGLHLRVNTYKYNDDGYYILQKSFNIPLSISSFKKYYAIKKLNKKNIKDK